MVVCDFDCWDLFCFITSDGQFCCVGVVLLRCLPSFGGLHDVGSC